MCPDESDSRRGPLPDLNTLLMDRNRDGFPDDIVGVLVVPEPLNKADWAAILNLAARLGLGSSGFTPPIVAAEPPLGRISVTIRPGDGDQLNQMAFGERELEASAEPPGLASPVNLADPWSIQGLLADFDDDQAADDAAIHIQLPDDTPFELGAALADLSTRIGVECGGLTLPIAGEETADWRTRLRFDISDIPEAHLSRDENGELVFSGNAASLTGAIRRLATISAGFLPDIPAKRSIDWLRRSAAGWTDAGRAAQLRHALSTLHPDRISILETEPSLRVRLKTIVQETNPEIPVHPPAPHETVIFDHQWSAEWEVKRLFQAFEQEILPKLDSAQPVNLVAMISEPPAIRRRVRGQMSRRMLELGFSEGSIHVLDAFKPGLGWLQEILLPELRDLDELDRVEILARSWDPDEHEDQLDMSIRWLQELFPGDEILADALGLPLEKISIALADDTATIYRVIAHDSTGNVLLERSFSPLWRRIDYLAGMPDAGNVTVTTGGIVAIQPGATHRARVLTDPEVFWRYVQGELLPGLRRFILGSTAGAPHTGDQPFFDDLLVDLRLSASDHPYGIRQEQHSAAEALHEDIYFNILDFAEELGRRTTGERLSAPGSVRPFVAVTPGRQPQARIRLTRRPEAIARIVSGGSVQAVQPATTELPSLPEVSGLTFATDRLIVEISTSSEFENLGDFLEALADESPPNEATTVLRIGGPEGAIEIGVPDPATPAITGTLAGKSVASDSIVSNSELFPHLNRLARHSSVTLVPAAETSWQGRPIPAIAVTSPQEAAVWSLRKLSHFKPTKLIVARHHANEVASTTSALQMIEALAGDATGESMLRGLNVVFLPLENPDGAALHDQLRQQNPTWKHHPARYNATGYEFGEDQGNPDSRYGEGRVRDIVWQACLPDIVVDNHGVPSHEWAQLFAGFGSPPRFAVSYWQVQALLYGILPWLDDSVHRVAMETVRDRVAAEIAEDPDLLLWNRIYAERYRAWGHRWLPERFPMELVQEMIFHINPVDPDSVRGRRSYAVRYPKTTVLNWITEVCDETVEGVELERTARAHLLANKAVMELLREQTRPLTPRSIATSAGVHIRTGRERPLQITMSDDS